jgi:hypothetical protein
MWQSFEEYMPAVGKRWWAMVVGGIFTIAGIISYFYPFLVLPAWTWFLIALLFISIAQFFAFHRVRVERDEARAERDVALAKTRDPIINPVQALLGEAYTKCKRSDHSWFNDERYKGVAYRYEHSDELGNYGDIRESDVTKTCLFCGYKEGIHII